MPSLCSFAFFFLLHRLTLSTPTLRSCLMFVHAQISFFFFLACNSKCWPSKATSALLNPKTMSTLAHAHALMYFSPNIGYTENNTLFSVNCKNKIWYCTLPPTSQPHIRKHVVLLSHDFTLEVPEAANASSSSIYTFAAQPLQPCDTVQSS